MHGPAERDREHLVPIRSGRSPAEPGPSTLDVIQLLFPLEPPRISVFTKKARVYMDVLLVTMEC